MTGRAVRLAGAQSSAPASSVPVGSFVYDDASRMWVEVTEVATDGLHTVIYVIDGHDVPLEYGADEPVAVCEAFTIGAIAARCHSGRSGL